MLEKAEPKSLQQGGNGQTPEVADRQLWQAVRDYYQRGFTPIPLLPNEKRPVTLNLPDGSTWTWGAWHDRRPTWNELERVFRLAIQQFGSVNVGLICGRQHGDWCALDIDSVERFKIACQAIGLKLPKTPTVKTVKGFHCYFKMPAYEFTRLARLDDWGVELRANHCYVVAPPSTVNGHQYHFFKHNGEVRDLSIPLAEIPAELLTALGLSPTPSTQPTPTDYLQPTNENGVLTPETIDKISELLKPFWLEGTRHDLSLVLSGWLLKEGYGFGDIERLIVAICNKAGDPEVKDRIRTLQSTLQSLLQKGLSNIEGWSGLAEKLDINTLKALR